MNNIVITMAGLGSRFVKAGYKLPKYEIAVSGKTLFRRSIESLSNFNFYDANILFAALKEHDATAFIVSECNAIGITNFKIVELEHLTRGQAETAYHASKFFDANDELLIFNIDTEIDPKVLSRLDIPANVDGWIPCFEATGDHWSFVRLSASGYSDMVSEKIRISNNASVGLYWFRTAKLFEEAFENMYLKNSNWINEMYIAPLYNALINNGKNVSIKVLPLNAVHVLGTPEEVSNFIRINEK